MNLYKISIFSLFCLLLHAMPANAERIKDVASLQGVRSNQLIGYGLVVGLNGTGDRTNQAVFTAQSFKSMLNKFGIRIPPNVNVQTNNVAAVLISAELPAFSKPGQTIDVTASSIGNAKSLRGGTLLMTPLKGTDGQVYAIAQGNLTVSGLGAQGADGSKVTVNVPSVGRIPNGATVERPSPSLFSYRDIAVYNLHRSDFTTVVRLADAINFTVQENIAMPLDSTSVQISLPNNPAEQIAYLAKIENISFNPGDAPAKVVVNSRTGTIVIGRYVKIKPAAITHGSLVVTISESPQVSQPEPFSQGATTVVPDSQVQVSEKNSRAFVFHPGPSLQDLVQAINSVGASPSDLAAILESLKGVGALEGELTIM